ncbi:MAG: PEP-CTERM sorting domain-containing protein [Bryobacteraceae bacterium]|nr:PEP-CTERM sorting domain-containing protein [Bryobacteraceae bacterium]
MVITYNSAVLMNELSLAFLYPTPQYGDASNEIAKVTFNDLFTYTLTADTTLTATWTGPGSVTNIEAAVEGFGGAWRISNPFGNNLVTSIRLESGNPGDNNTFGDFALFSATSSAVPEPGTYALLGTGLATLIAFARRRQK